MKNLRLISPNFPSFAEIEEYFKAAKTFGIYSNFGVVYNNAVSKLVCVYPNTFPVLVNNGTTAIQVAVKTLLPAGAKVAVPSFTFTATLQAVVGAHCKPVILQSNPYSWLMDPSMLIKHKDSYDAFIVVSPFGYAVDVSFYDNLAEALGKPVIYDFAAAFGNKISTKNITTFSFHATKTVPIGEGGAIMLPNPILQQAAKELINFDFNSQRIPKSIYGLNGKLDELHCAVLCAQLDRLSELFKPSLFTFNILEDLKKYPFTFALPRDGHFNLRYDHMQLPIIGVAASLVESFEKHLSKSGVEFKRYYYPYLNEAFLSETYIDDPDFAGKGIYGEDTTVALARPVNEQDYEYLKYVINTWMEGEHDND